MHATTATATVVEQIRRRILSGSLRPGALLPPERELAVQLDVSRATLRQGLSILSQMGLLTIHRGRSGGAVVTAPPPTTVSASIALLFQTRVITAGQLCEFRRALEVEAAQLAAARRSAAELAEISAALDAYLADGHDAVKQNAAGRAFHYAVARASGNPLLWETMTSINDAFATCLDLQHTEPDPARLIYQLHWPIVDAVGRGDGIEARQAMSTHFDQLQRALRHLGINERPVGSSTGGELAAIEKPIVPRSEDAAISDVRGG
jgi:DNA-binding FadR family transcriptional regulator